jgi:hypothetical protein
LNGASKIVVLLPKTPHQHTNDIPATTRTKAIQLAIIDGALQFELVEGLVALARPEVYER